MRTLGPRGDLHLAYPTVIDLLERIQRKRQVAIEARVGEPPNLLGMSLIIEDGMPPGRVEIRDHNGAVLQAIECSETDLCGCEFNSVPVDRASCPIHRPKP